MPAWVQVTGKERLAAKLKRLTGGVQGAALEDATIDAAVPVLRAAKRYAPKHEGTLERSIHIGGHPERSDDYDGNYERGPHGVPAPIVTPTRVEVAVGTDIIYGAQKEYGGTITAKNAPRLVWQDYEGNWHSAYSVYQSPQPYLRPAFDDAQGSGNWVKAFAVSMLGRIKGLIGG